MILAIDLGSTSFKAAVFDRRLRQLASGSARLSHRFGRGRCVEIEVASVQAALTTSLAAGSTVKVYGVPQTDGSIKGYVVFYYTSQTGADVPTF